MVTIRSRSAWDKAQISDFLQSCVIPVRLACNDSSGTPLICSLWYLYADGVLWCATQQSASIAALLEAQPGCGFEVAPQEMPYRGVRGQGVCKIIPDAGADILVRLMGRYDINPDSDFANWMLSRADTEVAIRIDPDWMTAWDFTGRMAE